MNFILTDFFERLDSGPGFRSVRPLFQRFEASVSVSVIKNGINEKDGSGRSVAGTLRKPENCGCRSPAMSGF